jgi:hypothetical protein
MALRSLDFVIPGEWQNVVGFENTIRTVTGETDEQIIQQIGDRAVYLYNDRSQATNVPCGFTKPLTRRIMPWVQRL